MKLELATWPDGTTAKDFSEEPEALAIESDVAKLEVPVCGNLSVHKNNNEVVVEGRLKANVTATCVRCLEDFPIPVDERFRRVASIVPDEQVEQDSGDPDFVFIPQRLPEWDLNEVFREIVLLAVPDDPLCRTDCAGICVKCGENRNSGSCNCPQADTHGAFSKLSELLDNKNSETTSGD